MSKRPQPKPVKREVVVEFVESDNVTDFDMLAKAIAGAIRKELNPNDRSEVQRHA